MRRKVVLHLGSIVTQPYVQSFAARLTKNTDTHGSLYPVLPMPPLFPYWSEHRYLFDHLMGIHKNQNIEKWLDELANLFKHNSSVHTLSFSFPFLHMQNNSEKELTQLKNAIYHHFPLAEVYCFVALSSPERERNAHIGLRAFFFGHDIACPMGRDFIDNAGIYFDYAGFTSRLYNVFGDQNVKVVIDEGVENSRLLIVGAFAQALGAPFDAEEYTALEPGVDYFLPLDVLAFIQQTRCFFTTRGLAGEPSWAGQHAFLQSGQKKTPTLSSEDTAIICKACENSNLQVAHRLGKECIFTEGKDISPAGEPDTDSCFLPVLPYKDALRLATNLTTDFLEYMMDMYAKTPLHEMEHDQRVIREAMYMALAMRANADIQDTAPRVSVLTLSYNHSQYIGQNIESVLAQQTNFPIEHVIVDDGSQDGTQDIILAYAAKHPHIRPLLLPRTRQDGKAVLSLFSMPRGEYAALCDGDDYFSDPCKLQKQADLLDAHPEYGLCFHPVRVSFEDGTDRSRIYPPLESLPRGIRPHYYLADLLNANIMQTNSVMYRWRFTNGLPSWFNPSLLMADWYWHILHAELGKIGFTPEVMSVYRRHAQALFYAAENTKTSIPHRLQHGLSELNTYMVINAHLKYRYERNIQSFANNVLVDLLQHTLSTGDDSWLSAAAQHYPKFVERFMQEVSIVKGPAPPA